MTEAVVQPDGTPITPQLPHSSQRVVTGFAVADVTAAQLPDVSGELVRVKARSANAGTVYIGGSDEVTSGTGFPLGPGDDTGWMPLNGLNHLYFVGENDTDEIVFLVV